jgi:uncharacterized protein (TIGR02118 family)
MIKVSILYPNKAASHFDADYYVDVHMPQAIKRFGPALKGVSAEIGVAGEAPGQPPPFAAIATFTCDSVQSFAESFLPHSAELMADIPNYTDIEPVIQISEIRISQ